jgi:DNA polymerase III subunit epsilon
MTLPAITSLPARVDIRDWPELKRSLGLRRKRIFWPSGEPTPIVEVESISTEMEPNNMHTEIMQARDWVRANPLYLDTETTGLDNFAQIVQIAILGDDGQALLDTFVRPTVPIPPAATAIHGIRDADVAGAPTLNELWPKLGELLVGRTVIIYNADYDLRLLRQSAAARRFGIPAVLESGVDWKCAMLLYADYKAEWDEFRGNNRWHRLEAACMQMRVDRAGIQAHAAAGDCELTRRLIHKLAEKEPWKVTA